MAASPGHSKRTTRTAASEGNRRSAVGFSRYRSAGQGSSVERIADQRPIEFLAECFWPGVAESDLHALDARAEASAAQLTATGIPVRYLGSLLLREDEVVLCRFEGTPPAVRQAAERARIPFERILELGHSPWQVPVST